MIDIENNKNTFHISRNSLDEIKLGNITFDPYTKDFKLIEDKLKINFTGGALIDEVGLGKTIQSIMLCILNPPLHINYTLENNINIFSRATLIICPNQLCGQWTREFKKMINTKKKKFIVHNILTKSHFEKLTYFDLLDADFVIISYNFLGNQHFLNKWLPQISNKKSYMSSKQYDYNTVEKLFEKILKEINLYPVKLSDNCPILPIITWNRIIIDEFHEPFTIDKYKFMANIIPHFRSNYKWCLSGTPFDKGTDNLNEMINFVTNYKNKYSNNIYNNNSIYEHLLHNFFRRNTKKSVEDEHKLPELTERIIWLKFSQTERMVYNAFLANPNIDKFDKLLRQLCCHPKIADQIKEILSECKTLEDIEKMMVLHYKKEAEDAKIYLENKKKSVLRIKKQITIKTFKRQRKFLKKDYNVKIEYPKFNIDDKNIDELDLYNSSDNESSEEENNKPTIIINNSNQKEIMKLVQKSWDKNESITLNNLYNILDDRINQVEIYEKLYKGKLTTYNFFTNVLEKIKKTVNKKKSDEELSDVDSCENGPSEESEYESEEYETDEYESDDDDEICGICLCPIEYNSIGVTKCGHIFDYECLKKSISTKPKCPMCNTKISLSEIYYISYEKKIKNPTVEVKDKLSLINNIGTKLANLIYYLLSIPDHVIIFSQWNDLLEKVGIILNEHGIKNVFCKGNVWQRDKSIREFNEKDNIKVIMLSSESAASGTNLTKASKVVLLDPVYGSYKYRKNTEWQAVGRSYRMGQTKPVEIVRLIIKDSIEEEIYNINKEEDKKNNLSINVKEINDDSLIISKEKFEKIKNKV